MLEELELGLREWKLKIMLVDPPEGVDWRTHPLMHSSIERSLAFASAQEAALFLQRVGGVLQRADHHPEWRLDGRLLHIRLTSHFLSNNLSNKDLHVARAIDRLHRQMKVSSLDYLLLMATERALAGALLWLLLGSAVCAGLMAYRHYAYEDRRVTLQLDDRHRPTLQQELLTLPLGGPTLEAVRVKREATPFTAQLEKRAAEVGLLRADFQADPQVGKAFSWDRGSDGYEANVEALLESKRGRLLALRRKPAAADTEPPAAERD